MMKNDDKNKNEISKIYGRLSIFGSVDSISKVAKVFFNKTTIDIYFLLVSSELIKYDVAKILNLDWKIVDHHLKKMIKANLVIVTLKPKTKRSKKPYKHYSANPYIFLAPSSTPDEIERLNQIFKTGVKFSSLFTNLPI